MIMKETGLNAYEIEAILVLLKNGQMTAMEISQKAPIPYSKIYEVLNSLKEKEWLKISESRPFKYIPVPPIEAILSIKLRLDDKYQNWKTAISDELQPLYEKRQIVEHPEMLILRGQEAVITKLEEILKKATKELMIAAPIFARNIISSIDPIILSFQKSVNVKLMVAGKAPDWLFLKKFFGVNTFRIRHHMFGGGIIADGKEAMLFLGEDKPSLVVWSDHIGLVGFAREYFQFLWDSSKIT
jgi:sugar-specific transcriptional regulator TrmB